MLLVGIKAVNLPSQIEFDFLKKFIVDNFGGHTCEEIKLAFNMAVSGKLEVDAKAYENFSCEYFGRIMTAYRQWAKNEIKYMPKEKEKDMEAESKEVDWSNYWNDILQAAMDGKIDTKIIPAPIYDYLVDNGILNLTVDQKKKLFERVKYVYCVQLGDRIIAKKNSPSDIQELAIIKDNRHIPDELRLRLQVLAKVEAVREQAKKMII
jgi:hypothetical protein